MSSIPANDRPRQTVDPNSASASKTNVLMAMQLEVTRVIQHALAEDLGVSPETVAKLSGSLDLCEFDVTTASTVPASKTATAQFKVKQAGILAGLPIGRQVFELLDPSIQFEELVHDGSRIDNPPQVVARVAGSARAILVAERTALNLMQRLSGVATAAHEYAKRLQPHGIAVLDTRKTTPGMRLLEKYAVRIGGGTNHRIGLFDAVLIKDNHISIAGGITAAVEQARARFPGKTVQVEVTNRKQLEEALAAGAEKIMLDNMNADQIREAIGVVNRRSFIEVSGGVNLENIEQYLIPGVDAISVGAVTHSVKSLDISLDIEA